MHSKKNNRYSFIISKNLVRVLLPVLPLKKYLSEPAQLPFNAYIKEETPPEELNGGDKINIFSKEFNRFIRCVFYYY